MNFSNQQGYWCKEETFNGNSNDSPILSHDMKDSCLLR